ncbi:MAG TPA: tetratricopeptide repeat protein [Flavobacteriales bacterium]|nr:tetratricopeptide repeat protein [Flavobacteriales bacterium]
MKHLVTIVVLLFAACGTPQERLAEEALRHGAALYGIPRFSSADSAFAIAPHDARALYNQGNANFRLGKWSEAIGHYRDAIATDSSHEGLGRANYNLGNAQLMEALYADTAMRQRQEELNGITIDGQDIAAKVSQFVLRDSVQRDVQRLDALIDSSLTQALDSYRRSLRHTPTNNDARYNFTYTQHLIDLRPKNGSGDDKDGDKDKDKDLSERAKLLMKRADELVDQYKFQEALDVLNKGLKEDPTLKQKKEYMDKLDVVTKAAKAT